MHEAKQMTTGQPVGAASHTTGGFSTAARIGSESVFYGPCIGANHRPSKNHRVSHAYFEPARSNANNLRNL
jgi:hypothetical protein